LPPPIPTARDRRQSNTPPNVPTRPLGAGEHRQPARSPCSPTGPADTSWPTSRGGLHLGRRRVPHFGCSHEFVAIPFRVGDQPFKSCSQQQGLRSASGLASNGSNCVDWVGTRLYKGGQDLIDRSGPMPSLFHRLQYRWPRNLGTRCPSVNPRQHCCHQVFLTNHVLTGLRAMSIVLYLVIPVGSITYRLTVESKRSRVSQSRICLYRKYFLYNVIPN